MGNNNLLKISSTGQVLSRISWGDPIYVEPESLIIDFDNNIYLVCYCRYYTIWNERYEYIILVTNPVNRDIPPKPRIDLDNRDYFLFSVVCIACTISPIALLSLLKSKKKRIN